MVRRLSASRRSHGGTPTSIPSRSCSRSTWFAAYSVPGSTIRTASGWAARTIALAMARTHLEAGHDVIVPQLLTRREFVEMLRETTESAGAAFSELTLMDPRDVVLARLEQRAETAGAFSARALMERQGNAPGDAYDAFVAALVERPEAIVIHDPFSEQAYATLLERLS